MNGDRFVGISLETGVFGKNLLLGPASLFTDCVRMGGLSEVGLLWLLGMEPWGELKETVSDEYVRERKLIVSTVKGSNQSNNRVWESNRRMSQELNRDDRSSY